MSFSANWKVAIICATVLLFLRAQGEFMDTFVFHAGIDLSCCVETSVAPISKAVRACYEQREYSFNICKVHAFIFMTVSNNSYCVDPKASWLPTRLEKLSAVSVNIDVRQ
uniref:Chemokine interleukin-8-like domain-containing protein n=1 Tax=Xiphophorus maculatus TaxID=8083 RepID=A0A3B5RF88_XIPMA